MFFSSFEYFFIFGLIRYDGIYKVRKYWPEKGKAGFIVWRYFLERKVPQTNEILSQLIRFSMRVMCVGKIWIESKPSKNIPREPFYNDCKTLDPGRLWSFL